MINPRSAATQGLGFSPLMIAAQGLLVIPVTVTSSGGGSVAGFVWVSKSPDKSSRKFTVTVDTPNGKVTSSIDMEELPDLKVEAVLELVQNKVLAGLYSVSVRVG